MMSIEGSRLTDRRLRLANLRKLYDAASFGARTIK
jgi:hypothetical protein